MRKILPALLLLPAAATAQTAATFDNLTLPGQDTAYINYSQPGQDVGFADGLAYFPCVYDTSSFGPYWAGGFAYSNERDTTNGTYLNGYAAKTGRGYNNSAQYAIYFQPYGGVRRLRTIGAAAGKAVRGFYITNTTYAYSSMKNGDFFVNPPFGGDTAKPNDFFKLTVRGYLNGAIKGDSVEFYLADFRSTNPANDYIVRDWTWVNLLPLGTVDSLDFSLRSSRQDQFGELVPTYFAMDNFTTDESATTVSSVARAADLAVYPNPATDRVWVRAQTGAPLRRAAVFSVNGQEVAAASAAGSSQIEISLAGLPAGTYVLRVWSEAGVAAHTFTKQ